MRDLCRLIGWMVVDLMRTRVMLEAEIWTLRQQINVLRRTAPKKLSFCAVDRMIFVGLYRLFPKICDALAIVKPDTLVRWHRAGFRSYWRWKSRRRGGRPIVPVEIRRLIREMSIANPLWGAPRIHGELLKLGIDIGQTSVAKYIARRRGPPSQGWKTFLNNHADGIAAMDLFGVTSHPTAEWMANQLTEACGWEQAPRYLIRDRDGVFGELFVRRLRSMGIRDRPTSPRSHGKTDLLSDSSVRSDGSALTMLLCSASGISVTYCCQRGPYASILGEGYAGLARRRADRAHSLPPSSRRAAPPIYPDLICDRHKYIFSDQKHDRATLGGDNAGEPCKNSVPRFNRGDCDDSDGSACRRSSEGRETIRVLIWRTYAGQVYSAERLQREGLNPSRLLPDSPSQG